MAVTTVLCMVAFLGAFVTVQSEKHSLYYIYTALSKPVNLPGIYEFNAMGLLNDRQIDYYNNKEQKKIPKQEWMREKMPPDYWEKGTQSRKSKEQWFNVNVNILMERMRHNNSDVHVLQWRHGCEIEKQENQISFFRGIDEYSYDGQNFLSFDDKVSQWVAPVDAALSTKRKWDNVPILNQYTKGYLEKECVDWLNKFREYGDEELRKGSPPDVHIFASKSVKDKTKLTLTCLATGFYPKDVKMVIRKYRTPLPDNEVLSTGIRPNHDGTYQLRKSVEISEAVADYDCFVDHATLSGPIITKWDAKVPPPTCKDTNCDKNLAIGVIIGIVIGVVLVGAVVGAVAYMLKKKRLLVFKSKNQNKPDVLLEKDQRNANETSPNNAANAGENAAMLKIEMPDISGTNSLESVSQPGKGSDDDVSREEKQCDSGQGSSASSQEEMNKSG